MEKLDNETCAYYKSRYGITFPVPTFEQWLQQQQQQQQQKPVLSYEEWCQTENLVEPHQPSPPQHVLRQTAVPKNNSEDTSPVDEQVKSSRTRWSKQQTTALIGSWVEHFDEIESFKAPHAWVEIKNKVNEHGTDKSVSQCKNKLKTMKDAYKKAKDNNRLTGTAPMTCPFFDEIDDIFSMRHSVNLPEVKEVGVPENGDKEEHSGDDDETHDPRSLFESEENVDTSAKESDFNSSFVEELTKDKINRKRKTKPLKNEKPKDENIQTIVKMFKESEENQQQFFKDIIETQRKIDAEEKARDQAFFLQLATILKGDNTADTENQ